MKKIHSDTALNSCKFLCIWKDATILRSVNSYPHYMTVNYNEIKQLGRQKHKKEQMFLIIFGKYYYNA